MKTLTIKLIVKEDIKMEMEDVLNKIEKALELKLNKGEKVEITKVD